MKAWRKLLIPLVAICTVMTLFSGASFAKPASSDAGWKVGTKLVIWTYGSNYCVRAFVHHVARLAPCAGYPSEEWQVRAIHTVHRGEKFSGYQLVNADHRCLAPSSAGGRSGTSIHGVVCDNSSKDHNQLWCVLLGETDAPGHTWIFFNAKSGLFLETDNSDKLGSALYEYNQNRAPQKAGKIFGDRR